MRLPRWIRIGGMWGELCNFADGMDKGKLIGHAACFTAYGIFGVNIIVCKNLTAGGEISPIAIFCLRSVGAGLLFWLISLFMPRERVAREDYFKIFLASLLGFFLTQMSFLMAIPYVSPTVCSIMSSLSPIYTMLIAAVAIREPITLKKATGVALSFAGIVYIIMSGSVGDGGERSEPIGVALMVVNALAFSLYLGVFKPVIGRYSVITFMKWIFLFSTAMSLPLAGCELAMTDYGSLPPEFLGELAFLVLFATFVTYFLIPIGQKRIRPTLVSMYSYVQPIIAIAISIAAGIEALTLGKAVAVLTVFAGVFIVSRSRTLIK